MKLKEYITANSSTAPEAYALYDKAIELGLTKASHDAYNRMCRKIFKGTSPTINNNTGEISRTTNPDGEIESVIRSQKLITNVEEMARFCNINMDDFLPPKIVTNRWADNWQFKVWWIPKYKKGSLTPKDAMAEFAQLMEQQKVESQKIEPIAFPKDGLTVIVGLTDSHVGALIWGDESSAYNQQNYDLKIAEKTISKAIDFYYQFYKDKKVKEFILPIGSDFLDIDNNENSTINGTIQTVDARPRKIWGVGLRIMKDAIDKLSSIAPVKGKYIPGNHDATVSYYLAVALDAYYRNNKNVDIDCAPTDRKYIKIGDTLLVLTHGKTIGKPIKPEQLIDIMSHEARELWGKTIHHEVIMGHYHAEKNVTMGVKTDISTHDIGSTIIRILPTMFPNNYWSNSSGYNAVQQMHCLGYNNKNIDEIKIYRP